MGFSCFVFPLIGGCFYFINFQSQKENVFVICIYFPKIVMSGGGGSCIICVFSFVDKFCLMWPNSDILDWICSHNLLISCKNKKNTHFL